MLRQLVNLWHYGRIRTNAPTPRKTKPRLLKKRPELEINNLLDFVVAHYGKPDDDFFFVQIGAFDGVTSDPIYYLARQKGWRGILVEPQAEAFELLKKNYSGQDGVQFFNVAIGPSDGEVTFYTRHSGMVQVASLSSHLMVKPGHGRRQMVGRPMQCWTLQTLLDKAQAPPHIDLLQIDAEGFDYKIIRSIDFSRVKPAIIRYEHMVLSQRDRNECLALLADQGYRFFVEDLDTTAYCPSAGKANSDSDTTTSRAA